MTEERTVWAIVWDNNWRRWIDSNRRDLADETAARAALLSIAEEYRARGWHQVREAEGGRQLVLGQYWPDRIFTVSCVPLTPEVMECLG